MKKRTTLLAIILCLTTLATWAQKSPFFRIYAGSNAPWGQTQSLTVESNGKASYVLSEVGKGDIDSSSFTIAKADMNKLDDLLRKINFFKLQPAYNERSVDGMRLSLIVNSGGKKHAVTWVNHRNKETSLILERVNAILKKKNLELNY